MVAALWVLAPAPSSAADAIEPSLMGLYYDWSLYGLEENGGLVCYLSSGLERSSDVVPHRRPPHILIANRPAENRGHIVSVDSGYVYQDGSQVLLSIGRKQFHLFPVGGAAWAQEGEDAGIVTAIRSGSTLVVTGRMKDGPATTDTFSLKGFVAALQALDRSCPVADQAAAPRARKRKRSQ